MHTYRNSASPEHLAHRPAIPTSPLLQLPTILLVALVPLSALSQQAAEDISGVYGTDSMISLATGYEQPLSRAPATATVVTRADIAGLGARTLEDVLNFVPAFQVSTPDGRTTYSTVRGITSRVPILIDNEPITRTLIDPWVGFDNILLHNIERIEVIRGPGSAVYGADVVAGAINIQTRAHLPSEQQELGVTAGRTIPTMLGRCTRRKSVT